jgi:hypothetical protein
MAVTINGTTGITTPDLDSTADITANSVPFGKGAGSISTNIAIGGSSLAANISGGNNLACGVNALDSNTTGNDNIAFGNSAGQAVVTASGNVFIGSNAGAFTTGAENTFIGSGVTGVDGGAGFYVTTGAKNTILGKFDGNQGGLDIRTASNNIVLSDGDGNPRVHWDSNGNQFIPSGKTINYNGTPYTASIATGTTGTLVSSFTATAQQVDTWYITANENNNFQSSFTVRAYRKATANCSGVVIVEQAGGCTCNFVNNGNGTYSITLTNSSGAQRFTSAYLVSQFSGGL